MPAKELMGVESMTCVIKKGNGDNGFLNSTGRLNRRQRTVRFLVGNEATEGELRTALGSPKVLLAHAPKSDQRRCSRFLCHLAWLHHHCRLGGPLVGGMVKSPLPSRGPHGGNRSIWLHCPYLLGFPIVGRKEEWKMGKYGSKR